MEAFSARTVLVPLVVGGKFLCAASIRPSKLEAVVLRTGNRVPGLTLVLQRLAHQEPRNDLRNGNLFPANYTPTV